jgi:hypothetical protein|tara:strand:+ start:3772 stop:4254 length:483 start_codon:yes stop_codon:yes gene_type:complete
METEKLKIKLELYATMWRKPPQVEILIDNKTYFCWYVEGSKDKPTVIEFEHEFESDKEYNLVIKRSGKTDNDTVVNEKGDITHDQLLHIKSVEIDEIDIGSLVYTAVYTPEYPELWAKQQSDSGIKLEESFQNVVIMGHNGTWKFKFASPFYMWLLENLY